MLTSNKRLVCGITMGDPSGIGPEIILKGLTGKGIQRLGKFVVIGDKWILNKCKTRIQKFDLIYLKNVPREGFAFGKIKAEYGKAALEYLDTAIELLKNKRIDCLVTAPLNKKAVTLSGCAFSGHTEYLSQAFQAKNTQMMLFNQKIRVVLVSRHIPLKDVAGNLSIGTIFKTISAAASSLKSLFSLRNPNLAVCGLNPHASDNGIIGTEENDIIIPAINKAKAKGIKVDGPHPADTIFNQAIRGKYDCLICMYHDQGMIPLKLTGFNQTVNITLGLPFARTSPGGGTAFDIAGQNQADPQSFIQAVKTAIQCAKNLRKA